MSGPLAERRVLVTRAAHQAGKLSEGLRALDAEPVEVPVLEIRPPRDCAPLDAALRQLSRYDWFIVASANAVRSVVARAGILGISTAPSEMPRIAAVGPATAAAVRKAGLEVALIPPAYIAEALAEALADQVAGTRVLVARAEIARDAIPDALRAAGAQVDVVDAYRNVLPEAAPELLRVALRKGIDAATFTSSSSVTHLAAAARAAGVAFPFAGVPAISIGPMTSATLRDHGWEPAAEARVSDVPGLIDATRKALTANCPR
ncbi:MAG TPA: uroporphyrinogen-III synthase [Terracidiphilus sp.]|nr:uroporphyrinogen-III synthase [Terracidiphilus sp.]